MVKVQVIIGRIIAVFGSSALAALAGGVVVGQNYIASSPASTSTQFTIYNMAGSTAYTVYFMVFA